MENGVCHFPTEKIDGAKERIYLTVSDIEEAKNTLRYLDHIERYQLIKRYCFGRVLDCACGVGYGSYLLSNNPDIEKVIGIDVSEEAIRYAVRHFLTEKTFFHIKAIADVDERCDTLVCLETIEHIESLSEFQGMVKRVAPKVIILSYPTKKSTHFNKYHLHDLTDQCIVDMLEGYVQVRNFNKDDVRMMVFTKLAQRIPSHLFRNPG